MTGSCSQCPPLDEAVTGRFAAGSSESGEVIVGPADGDDITAASELIGSDLSSVPAAAEVAARAFLFFTILLAKSATSATATTPSTPATANRPILVEDIDDPEPNGASIANAPPEEVRTSGPREHRATTERIGSTPAGQGSNNRPSALRYKRNAQE
mmetsp:Transcript_53959/g.89800  ORF Transcript_53959/g.89800 Transcript_53959/m.89800 type:complete len:156 (-) Transcript_53959:1962-2429(-)